MVQKLLKVAQTGGLLPIDYIPSPPRNFQIAQIFLAKGSLGLPARASFVERICEVYPEAEVIERLDLPHNRIDLCEKDALKRHQQGKHTLVFGEHQSAVRFSEEEGNACPNYWHFSPYGFCFYECKYCYLAGTPSFWHSPAVRIYLNLEEMLWEIDRIATGLKKPTAFYLGKLQDGLALDPLTGFSKVLVPFFAQHLFARQIILTKSAEVDRLLKLEHKEHTILSWSLNPPEVSEKFEPNVPPVEQRIQAMQKCAEKGYPIRAVLMPIVPVENWEKIYSEFVQRLVSLVPLQRLTLGGICSYQNARRLMELKLGKENEISRNLEQKPSADGRIRYPVWLRAKIYARIIQAVREIKPKLELALCLEEFALWKALGLSGQLGRCNCVL